MTWKLVDGKSGVYPSNTYEVSVVVNDRDGGQQTLIFDDPEEAIRLGREMVRVGEQVKARRAGA